MSPLLSLITARIDQNGPLMLSDYMAECLLHPKHGYYATRDPLGATGDFTTAPEISQMFGELVGLSLAQAWLDQGAPNPFVLAELGPGRGTLMADILRVTRGVAGFHDAMQVFLLEASPVLQAKQAGLLGDTPVWIDTIDALPDLPLFLVANEFFDALPVRQFIRDGQGWRERLVTAQKGALSFALGSRAMQPGLTHRIADTADGDLVEICEAAKPVMSGIGRRISDHGGAALILDYGDWRSLGDTLQALRAHKKADPLETPGAADLTTHVDFEALALTAPCRYSRLSTQGVFLERLGITQRAQALAANLTGTALDGHIAAHRRLTHPEEMGTLFKVMALYPEGAVPPAGCEP